MCGREINTRANSKAARNSLTRRRRRRIQKQATCRAGSHLGHRRCWGGRANSFDPSSRHLGVWRPLVWAACDDVPGQADRRTRAARPSRRRGAALVEANRAARLLESQIAASRHRSRRLKANTPRLATRAALARTSCARRPSGPIAFRLAAIDFANCRAVDQT